MVSHLDMIEMLFERQEDIPKWSSTVNDCQVCVKDLSMIILMSMNENT